MKCLCPLLLLVLLGCGRPESITKLQDYQHFLQGNSQSLKNINSDLQFWSDRLEQVPHDFVSQSKIGSLYATRFQYSGSIEDLHKSDSLFRIVNTAQRKYSSSTFRALASNAISQHKFQQAKKYIDSALALGDDRYLSLLIDFDIAIELGDYHHANQVLHAFANQESFEVLIRRSKYSDKVNGDLEEAIVLMERARKKTGSNRNLELWTKSNLADLYGHANSPRKSYRLYLEVLTKDPEYYHALKGIAWIAFSHDKNSAAAKRILIDLKKNHPVPDYDLILAEIETYEGNKERSNAYLSRFHKSCSNPAYGDMYNKYLFDLAADEFKNIDQAVQLATEETIKRPTAESFSWLAWAKFRQGNIQEAYNIARVKVEGKCFEPGVLFRLGLIYNSAGEKQKAREFLKEAKSSGFEIGPVLEKEISTSLASL